MQRLTRLALATLLLAIAPATSWSQGTPLPNVQLQFFDNLGNPCSGCLLNAFAAGSTTTRQATYTTNTLTLGTENANPIVMDSAGRPTTGYIYLSATSYRFVLTDSTGGTQYWEADNTPSVPTTAAGVDVPNQTAGEALSVGDAVYLSDGSGALIAGRWYKADADFTYASSLAGRIGMVPTGIASGASGTIRIGGLATGLSGLNTGSTYYISATGGALTSTIPPNARVVGTAATSTTLVFSDTGMRALPTVLTKTTTYSVAQADGDFVLVKADATAGSFTINLYTAVGSAGRRVYVKRTDATAARVITIDPNASETIDGATTATLNTQNEVLGLESDGTNWQILDRGPPTFMGAEGRLTAQTATCVPTIDVTAATSVFYTPCGGSRIALYDGTAVWNVRSFTELSLSISGCTASKPYDVFVYDNAGAPALEMLVWTNATTRATALVQQDGVLVKTGALTRRFVGTFYCDSSGGQTDDTLAKAYVWNMYNRRTRPLRRIDATASWTYNSATIRQANASTANQVEVMVGLSEDAVAANVLASAQGTIAETPIVTIGLDSTTAAATGVRSAGPRLAAANQDTPVLASFTGFPGVGFHFLAWLEARTGSNTMTFEGQNGTSAQSGIEGTWTR